MKDNDDIKPMIDAILGGSKDEFASSFDDSLKGRISDQIAVKHHELAKDILKTDTTKEQFISKLNSLTNEENQIILDDKNLIILNKEEANLLVNLFENLNEDNKKEMINTTFKNEKNFKEVFQLAKEIKK